MVETHTTGIDLHTDYETHNAGADTCACTTAWPDLTHQAIENRIRQGGTRRRSKQVTRRMTGGAARGWQRSVLSTCRVPSSATVRA